MAADPVTPSSALEASGRIAGRRATSSWFSKLYVQVMIGMIAGGLVGHFFPHVGQALMPLAEGFIKLIKMMIAPIVFCFVVTGICSAGDLRKAGRVAAKTIVYFEIVTTLAILIGLLLAYALKPGAGMNIDPAALDASAVAAFAGQATHIGNGTDFVMNIIPATFWSAFVKGDILQVLLLAVLVGTALQMLGERGKAVVGLIDDLSQVLFKVMGVVVRLAPIGVMGAIAFTTAKFGIGTVQRLGALIAVYYLSCAVFIVVVLGVVMRLAGLDLWKFTKYFKDEILIAMGSSSSDAVMPVVMAKLRHLGIKDTTVGLVVPTGYSFNLDGFSIWLSLCVVFIAQATNTPLSTSDLVLILGVSLLTSKGAHGVPGSAIVVLAATLSAIPALPVVALTIVLAVDKLLGYFRIAVNLLGNCVGAVAIAAWEKDIDVSRARSVLDGNLEFRFDGEGRVPPDA
ncbi:Aerobic C4-dicarboxylate transport protein [Burkholderia pseudomultivorans]|uniref:Aerobic C4-dicarboxylate transport protein n=1 Tax=Burkholderia pseudomultivorans TaxID=1207504 RepID=A0ABU2EE41_9BURK|nr:C4-dicarboxylate transporter DctA [Burkholderia pseudomultivorans]MDR8731726.1 Aerobic C4-dicarboxylate transport protein [Burkholderia pseudomultivorans]MDR8739063.1 Aerobic C4-dicarboxylate transport protein [Burkholderia pseudomultivorans]MDR8745625.1 Aerobic C4-dicarboxylate transport protein [Burkholderia pseudomultivorans]MDR8757919.1 Aerobic C4-dicarboxylate transport protein [Burkholderia pseudomultivorans]MDR8781966.1 Aerobic C4-dicarboxylate transport protein [Burkholderia pseudom